MPDRTHRESISALVQANLGLRFLLEVAALAALSFWGFHCGKTMAAGILLGVGAPLLAAVIWGRFAAPRSPRRMAGAALIAVQLSVLGAGALALAAAGRPLLASLFAAVILVNAALLHASGRD